MQKQMFCNMIFSLLKTPTIRFIVVPLDLELSAVSSVYCFKNFFAGQKVKSNIININ